MFGRYCEEMERREATDDRYLVSETEGGELGYGLSESEEMDAVIAEMLGEVRL
jgi:hypothetical protein